MPRNRTLACVFAHPDDDAYGAAGSVALHADEPDFRFVLVHATFGEHGEIRDGFPATRRPSGPSAGPKTKPRGEHSAVSPTVTSG